MGKTGGREPVLTKPKDRIEQFTRFPILFPISLAGIYQPQAGGRLCGVWESAVPAGS